MRVFVLCSLLLFAALQAAHADDWPQWLGPERDSVWREKGIVDRFPTNGLEVKWRVPVELGYSGPAVVDDRVFVFDYAKTSGTSTNNPGGRDKLEGKERVLCLSAATGKQLWKHQYDCSYNISYPSGPRCTPTVDSGRVYTLGAEGNLYCLNTESGDVIWSKELKKEYKTETPIWGFAAHPLVVGDLLYCVVGGQGSVAVAFDKKTGREVWRALSNNEPGYCPPTLIEHAGTKQLLIWHPKSLNALNPLTGDVHWSVDLAPSYGMSVTAPRKTGNYLFASGIGNIGALIELGDTASSAEVKWRGNSKSAFYSCNSTPIIDGELIYGNDCQTGMLIGARIEDGKRVWETREPTSGGNRRASHGTAYLVKHEDRYFIASETGDLILAELSPQGYKETSRFHMLDPTNECFGRAVVWSHPAFARRCVFARNDKELVCINLAASK